MFKICDLLVQAQTNDVIIDPHLNVGQADFHLKRKMVPRTDTDLNAIGVGIQKVGKGGEELRSHEAMSQLLHFCHIA